MSDIISGAALGPAGPVVKKALDALEPTIRKGATGLARHLIDRTVANLQIGFSDYLRVSYNRCRSVKTLLSQDKPLVLLDIYVHLLLEYKDEIIEDDDLIANLESYGRIVITGLAGCGKSMFMKYVTLCRFENGQGKIPLFVELRQLNSLTTKNLLAYIHESCALAGNRVTYDQFELSLRAGGIVLILDGFDEIDMTHREAISGQILEISMKYPQIPIVVSSRPDDKFASWQSFFTFTIKVLDKGQVLELIKKIDYDDDLKKRFHREVDKHLYDSHTSFLSSPLLASIMLLTYEQFAEIPTKMHIFYSEAFEALFRRHDAQKSQFVRKTYASLPIDDFKKFFASFCVFSYSDEHFSFLDEDLKPLIARSLTYAGLKANVDDICKDLYECVCMLQRDGITTVFVHRSFQEYFSAVFIAAYHGDKFQAMLDRCAERIQDQVIPMLFEMARDRLEREWLLPELERVIRASDREEKNPSYADFARETMKNWRFVVAVIG